MNKIDPTLADYPLESTTSFSLLPFIFNYNNFFIFL